MDKPRRRTAGRPAGPPDRSSGPELHTAAPPDATAVPSTTSSEAGRSAGEWSPGDLPAGIAPEGTGPSPHRRRQRPPRGPASIQDDDPPDPGPAPATPPVPADIAVPAGEPTAPVRVPSGAAAPREDRRRAETAVERSLRALVTVRATQLPPSVAMRAREVAVPTAQDLAEAERDLVIVRRHYVPPAPLATKKSGTPVAEPRRPGRRSGRAGTQ